MYVVYVVCCICCMLYVCCHSVGSVYGEKIAWLRDETFLDELERDSVDSEVFEEELDLLRSQQPLG